MYTLGGEHIIKHAQNNAYHPTLFSFSLISNKCKKHSEYYSWVIFTIIKISKTYGITNNIGWQPVVHEHHVINK
jgi:hypothetical protein